MFPVKSLAVPVTGRPTASDVSPRGDLLIHGPSAVPRTWSSVRQQWLEWVVLSLQAQMEQRFPSEP